MTQMAILQEVDKCIRCNGCVISCKRTWQMKAETIGVHKVAFDQRVAIKSQKRVDVGPFVRYSCWHCYNPPCAGRCPFKAISKDANGGVNVDMELCNPAACDLQCVQDCQRGGYPKPAATSGWDNPTYPGPKAQKCTMCSGRSGLGGDLPTRTPNTGTVLAPVYNSAISGANVPELAHEPACVYTCPAKAMTYDTRANIMTKVQQLAAAARTAGKPYSYAGDGGVWWFSAKATILPPKADPFVEDHIGPTVSGLLSSPFAQAAVVPTLVVGGLLALSARRTMNEKSIEGEVA